MARLRAENVRDASSRGPQRVGFYGSSADSPAVAQGGHITASAFHLEIHRSCKRRSAAPRHMLPVKHVPRRRQPRDDHVHRRVATTRRPEKYTLIFCRTISVAVARDMGIDVARVVVPARKVFADAFVFRGHQAGTPRGNPKFAHYRRIGAPQLKQIRSVTAWR
jgi:hypothetical protein